MSSSYPAPYHRSMSSAHPRIVLYERDGCHLCEEAAAVLDAALGKDGYARVDIDASDDLVVRYGFRVPVVAVAALSGGWHPALWAAIGLGTIEVAATMTLLTSRLSDEHIQP